MYGIKRKVFLTIIICTVCFLGAGLGHRKDDNYVPISQYEQFSGKLYDENRRKPKDMASLLKQWESKYGEDTSLFIHASGWRYVADKGCYGMRYYIEPEKYVVGWQFLSRDGFNDWYYFDEKTGMLVTNTIVDGVVLSKSGYATAIAAYTAESIELVHESDHCEEVLLLGNIDVEHKISLRKNVSLLSLQNEVSTVRRTVDAGDDSKIVSLLEVREDSCVTLGPGVEVDTNGTAGSGIRLLEQARLECYGSVKNETEQMAMFGIAAISPETMITVYPGAYISGAETGIYSEGETILVGDDSVAEELAMLPAFTVKAATVSSGKMISGNKAHGITQSGGTLTMKGGNIYNNGTLGSASEVGSYGGGVYLKNKARMNMSGGVISGNRATFGGGIYVSSGCQLNVTGGTIGGSKRYVSQASNTVEHGNYAREHKTAGGGKKYGGGSGGGIYSEGTVNINGKQTVNISNNLSKGAGGAGGILVFSGKTYITGTVNINNNRAASSDASSNSQLLSGDPNAEGAAIRVGYEAVQKDVACYINCTAAKGCPVTEGTVSIKNNQASGDGGAIFVSSGENMSLIVKGDTSITDNLSESSGGGGVKSLGGYLEMQDAVISRNVAKEGRGGGICCAADVYLRGCTISDNKADKEGGGVVFYESSVGTLGKGTINKCEIYNNASGAGAAGIELRNASQLVLGGNTSVYSNGTERPGIRCTSAASLTVNSGYIYGNGTYGIYNQGKTDINGVAIVGCAGYQTLDSYNAMANFTGGIYNSGDFTVNTGKNLYVYSGSGTGFYNRGTAVFEDGSYSVMTGLGTDAIIKNTGTLTAVGTGGDKNAIVELYGSNTKCGLVNDGGTLDWSGLVSGGYTVKTTGISKSDSAGNVAVGVSNRNGGTLRTYTVSSVKDCSKAVENRKDSDAYISGEYTGNINAGLENAGTLYLGSTGNTRITMNEITGISNTGTLYGDAENSYFCKITGTGYGIKNAGFCRLGKNMWIASSDAEKRTGIVNEEKGALYIHGGIYNNSQEYAVFCKSGSSFFMGDNARIDKSNLVFLEPEVCIQVDVPFRTSGVAAVIDTDETTDRMPGRVLVKSAYPGGTGKKVLYESSGEPRFCLAYDMLDKGSPALLLDGSRLAQREDIQITEKDVYLSTYYPVTFRDGHEQIAGGKSEDISLLQAETRKYWMEDLILDLTPPTLLTENLLQRGWKFIYWEGDNQMIYSLPSEIYGDDKPLVLTANWKPERESTLDAWLYDRSLWLRNQMKGKKTDEEYKYFLAGDTGVITFSCIHLTEVSISWPSAGNEDELRTYDKTGTLVLDKRFLIEELAEDMEMPYENSSYQFQIPVGTPPGIYYVTVTGIDENNARHDIVLSMVVGDKHIASTIRTRIR